VPLPEQIRSYIGKDGKVASEIVEHAGWVDTEVFLGRMIL
jgi:hypothetical protein